MALVLLPWSWFVNDKHWAIQWTGIAVGVETVAQCLSANISPFLKPYAEEIVVDGLSVGITIAAGTVVRPIISLTATGTNNYMTFAMDDFTVAAAVRGQRVYAPLNIIGWMGYQDAVDIYGAYALNDTVSATLWGHYMPLAKEMAPQEPQPVSVQEFHLFRPRKVSGPV